jgi:hypothetical protein
MYSPIRRSPRTATNGSHASRVCRELDCPHWLAQNPPFDGLDVPHWFDGLSNVPNHERSAQCPTIYPSPTTGSFRPA